MNTTPKVVSNSSSENDFNISRGTALIKATGTIVSKINFVQSLS